MLVFARIRIQMLGLPRMTNLVHGHPSVPPAAPCQVVTVPETRVVEVPVERIVTVTVERPPPDAAEVCTRQACWRGRRRSPVLHILEGGG